MPNNLYIPIVPRIHPVIIIAYLNLFLVMVMMIVFFSFFANPVGYEVRMPLMGSGAAEINPPLNVRITAENVLYFNDKVVTFNDLKRELLKTNLGRGAIYINVDKRASMGRVTDIWQLCNSLGIAAVKINSF